MRLIALVVSIVMVVGNIIIAYSSNLGVGILLGALAVGCVLCSFINKLPGITPLSLFWVLGMGAFLYKAPTFSSEMWMVIVVFVSLYLGGINFWIGIIAYYYRRGQQDALAVKP